MDKMNQECYRMNNKEIYYFSGTGNSLVVARDIAEKLEGDLIPIHSVVNKERITTHADVIGILFPVYYVGLINIPLIVQRFTSKLDEINNKYIFAVCTYGGGAGPTLTMLDEMIRARGGRLKAGFGVQMPQNAFRKPFENREKLYSKWKDKKLDSICEHVNQRDFHFDTDNFSMRIVGTILLQLMKNEFFRPLFIKPMKETAEFPKDSDLTVREIIPFIDRSYHTGGSCMGCKTCSRICPVGNIEIVDDKPVWKHHCENCLACIKWCPQEAIHGFGEQPEGYHHPDVGISDMLRG